MYGMYPELECIWEIYTKQKQRPKAEVCVRVYISHIHSVRGVFHLYLLSSTPFYVRQSKAVVDLGFKVLWYLVFSVRVLVAQWLENLTSIRKIWVQISATPQDFC